MAQETATRSLASLSAKKPIGGRRAARVPKLATQGPRGPRGPSLSWPETQGNAGPRVHAKSATKWLLRAAALRGQGPGIRKLQRTAQEAASPVQPLSRGARDR